MGLKKRDYDEDYDYDLFSAMPGQGKREEWQ